MLVHLLFDPRASRPMETASLNSSQTTAPLGSNEPSRESTQLRSSSTSLVRSCTNAVDAPTLTMRWSSMAWPYTCAHGKNDSVRSSGRTGNTLVPAWTFDVKLSCVSITPLGFPVVPDV